MNKYWFRKRRGLFSRDLGWGFVSKTIEGYGVTALWFAIIVGLVCNLIFQGSSRTEQDEIYFLVLLLGSLVFFCALAWFKCEK